MPLPFPLPILCPKCTLPLSCFCVASAVDAAVHVAAAAVAGMLLLLLAAICTRKLHQLGRLHCLPLPVAVAIPGLASEWVLWPGLRLVSSSPRSEAIVWAPFEWNHGC